MRYFDRMLSEALGKDKGDKPKAKKASAREREQTFRDGFSRPVFVGGPTGKGWGCTLAYRRAVKNYRERVKGV